MPEIFVEQHGRDLRFVILSPDTEIKKRTFGANIEAYGVLKKFQAILLTILKRVFVPFLNRMEINTEQAL